MSQQTKARLSNFELLRIIAMLLIIVSHYSVIGIMHTSFGEPYQIWASGQFVNRAFSSLMACGGDTGVGAFFMISGFFLCRKKTCEKNRSCCKNYLLQKLLLHSRMELFQKVLAVFFKAVFVDCGADFMNHIMQEIEVVVACKN